MGSEARERAERALLPVEGYCEMMVRLAEENDPRYLTDEQLAERIREREEALGGDPF